MVFYDIIPERRFLPVRLWHPKVGKKIIGISAFREVIKYDALKRTRYMCGGHILVLTTAFRRFELRGSGSLAFRAYVNHTSSHSHIIVQTVDSFHITSHVSS